MYTRIERVEHTGRKTCRERERKSSDVREKKKRKRQPQ